ncbi:dTDP-4-dehydrorhamnose reductase [Paenibacillus sp. MZ04-78.2]|uniref:dTDP-4-dehydrorhamnose reductase n=1 Tax=Paenibacillus sp. MZ04-78.2 TaxID=2962034 RepID=UPI0020B69F65|nr:dTDP-4-dehydrorhamnose reductase [Paenibacillus sp. MZ04-78.2]MCP3773559.1 dTDP-4-dehydrorhamnose reductase [Paenibacillus sp. MZ04-78.2]
MKMLITGAGGQLGRDLVRVLGRRHDCAAFTRQQLDIADEKAVRRLIAEAKPEAIVHAAAYTKVDQAEAEPEETYRINAIGASHVAISAEAVGAKMVYVSTDYVFDGTKGEPYDEQDRTNPLSVYGKSKLLGEQLVQAVCPRHFIVRTSWLYGKDGNNFVTKVLALAERQQELTVVDDQFGSPTYTYDLAECIGGLLETDRYGIYHVANRGYCSRWALAKTILELAGHTGITVRPARSDDYALPAPRPAHSAFADRGLRLAGLPRMRDWKTALEAFLRNDWGKSDENGDRRSPIEAAG